VARRGGQQQHGADDAHKHGGRHGHTARECASAFFGPAWARVAGRIAADLRVKTDLRDRQGIGAALAAASGAITLSPGGDSIVVDKLQDNATSARGAGVTFIPTVFGSPHLVTMHSRP
jgi:hypothetical protein